LRKRRSGYLASWLRTSRRGLAGSAWVLGIVAAIALLVTGLLGLAHFSRQQVRGWDRYTVRFGDVECTPPPGLERRQFLDEVQYLAGFPEHLQILDDGLPARLAEGFAKHPLVEKVTGAEILPNRKIRVDLVYRAPSPK
jgi:hypothetical protein